MCCPAYQPVDVFRKGPANNCNCEGTEAYGNGCVCYACSGQTAQWCRCAAMNPKNAEALKPQRDAASSTKSGSSVWSTFTDGLRSLGKHRSRRSSSNSSISSQDDEKASY